MDFHSIDDRCISSCMHSTDTLCCKDMLIRMTAFETVIASVGILFAKLSLYTKTGLARTLCELCLRALKLMRLARSKLCVIYFVYVRSLLRKGFYNFSLFEREMFITSDEKSGSSKVFSCNSSIFHSPVSNCFVACCRIWVFFLLHRSWIQFHLAILLSFCYLIRSDAFQL